MTNTFLPSSPRMREVWIWIGHYADGTEGMLSGDFPGPIGTPRHMPLMSSIRANAESYEKFAGAIMSPSQHAPAKIVRIELRRFVALSQ